MSKTDPEDRLPRHCRRLFHLLDNPSDIGHRLLAHVRISGTVAQEETRALFKLLVQGIVPGHDPEASAAFSKAPQLVVLHSAVHDQDLGMPLWVQSVACLSEIEGR